MLWYAMSAPPAVAFLGGGPGTSARAFSAFHSGLRYGSMEGIAIPQLVLSLWGCILSSLLLLLDWEEWWQQWPLVGLAGMCLGRVTGAVVSSTMVCLQQPRTPAKIKLE